ncbi:MAG TPA: hypothetical protein VLG27_04280, partial [Candidatus Saccharimonadia bacterium]|nr:hypothetical protein [Candidatus Saccharimonadia bacterium]
MSRPRLVIDIEPIYGHSVIGDREVLERFVELPLLAACQHLYDLNVRTIQSSANRNDILVDAPAWIVLDLEGLSTANLAYAEPQAVEISPFMDGDVLRRPARFIFPMTPI